MVKRLLLRLLATILVLAPASAARALYDADLSKSVPTAPAKLAAAPQPTKPTVSTENAAAVTVTAVVPDFNVDWSANTPALYQGSLLGGYACAPTSLAMITSYYSRQYAVGSRTAEEFIANLKPGEFVAGEGVPYQKLARQLAELKYRSITGHTGSSLPELQKYLQAGPTIVTAGGTVAGARASHSLVVTAISKDGAWVKLNDPADGRNHTLSWSKFDALWAGGSRGILIVLP